jgi:acetamidase/formamidase
MLGCIGVAPPRGQVLVSHDLGAFGGNLDYWRIASGATIYLPVFVPGALLYMGDGHAAQGAGELTGDALEISAKVEFSVDVLPETSHSGPRISDDKYWMASGIAGSLDRALQAATGSLVRWLRNDYELSEFEIAMVLGSSIRYDIAVLVNPQYHVVARIPQLPQTARPRRKEEFPENQRSR